MPIDYEAFFDRVADVQAKLYDVEEDDLSTARELLEGAVESLPSGSLLSETSQTFDVLASDSLSGGGYPCSSQFCRTKSAQLGARFAALYVDHIWIRDPFERLLHHQIDDERYVTEALAAIASFDQWKPLLLAGIATHMAPVCMRCAAEQALQSNTLKRPVEELAESLAAQFEKMASAEVCLDQKGKLAIQITMPTRYTGHRQLYLPVPRKLRTKLSKLLGKRPARVLGKDVIPDFDAFLPMWAPILNEAIIQAAHRGLSGCPYASNLEIDLEVAARSTGSADHHVSQILGVLRHAVPIVENVPLETVLRLRQEDDGTFQLYRNRVAAIREQVQEPKTLRDAAEQLKAEVSALETKIASKKKSVWDGLRDQVLIGTGTVAAGLATWLTGALNPTWSTLLAAVGGLPAAQKILSDALATRHASLDDMQQPLYFLWKLKKAARRKL